MTTVLPSVRPARNMLVGSQVTLLYGTVTVTVTWSPGTAVFTFAVVPFTWMAVFVPENPALARALVTAEVTSVLPLPWRTKLVAA